MIISRLIRNGAVIRAVLLAVVTSTAVLSGRPLVVPFAVAAYALGNAVALTLAAARASGAQGNAAQGTAVQGSAVQGSSVQGSAVQGTALRGAAGQARAAQATVTASNVAAGPGAGFAQELGIRRGAAVVPDVAS